MDKLCVIQADRDAAWDFLLRRGIPEHYCEAVQAGEWDQTEDVLMFTRHRIASQAELVGALGKIRDRCQQLRNGADDWFELVEIQAVCSAALSHTKGEGE